MRLNKNQEKALDIATTLLAQVLDQGYDDEEYGFACDVLCEMKRKSRESKQRERIERMLKKLKKNRE